MHLAIRSCMGLGILFMMLALIMVVGMALAPRGAVWFSIIALFFFGIPGALYVVVSVFMRRRQQWSAILGIVVASIHGLLALLVFLTSLLTVANSPVTPIVSLLWVAAMAQLIYQLAKSPAAMRADEQYQPRGFEVLPMATRVDENK
jgi:Na+/proline symporter